MKEVGAQVSSFNLRTALIRRWYIVLVGVLLMAGGGYATTVMVPAHHEVTANVVLLPPKSETDQGENPYLSLTGLDTMGGLLARAVTSPEMQQSLLGAKSKTTYEVVPDQSITGPVLAITVNDPSLDGANRVLDQLLTVIPDQLRSLQTKVGTPTKSYITSTLVSEDREGTVVRTAQTRAMVLVVGLIGGLTLLLAGLVEIMSLRRRARSAEGAAASAASASSLSGLGAAAPAANGYPAGLAGLPMGESVPVAPPATVHPSPWAGAGAVGAAGPLGVGSPLVAGTSLTGVGTPLTAGAGSVGTGAGGLAPAAAAGVGAGPGRGLNGTNGSGPMNGGVPYTPAPPTPSKGWLLQVLTKERENGDAGQAAPGPRPDLPSATGAGPDRGTPPSAARVIGPAAPVSPMPGVRPLGAAPGGAVNGLAEPNRPSGTVPGTVPGGSAPGARPADRPAAASGPGAGAPGPTSAAAGGAAGEANVSWFERQSAAPVRPVPPSAAPTVAMTVQAYPAGPSDAAVKGAQPSGKGAQPPAGKAPEPAGGKPAKGGKVDPKTATEPDAAEAQRVDPPTGSFERLVQGTKSSTPKEPGPRAAAHRLT